MSYRGRQRQRDPDRQRHDALRLLPTPVVSKTLSQQITATCKYDDNVPACPPAVVTSNDVTRAFYSPRRAALRRCRRPSRAPAPRPPSRCSPRVATRQRRWCTARHRWLQPLDPRPRWRTVVGWWWRHLRRTSPSLDSLRPRASAHHARSFSGACMMPFGSRAHELPLRQRGRHHVPWYRKITPGHVVILGMAVGAAVPRLLRDPGRSCELVAASWRRARPRCSRARSSPATTSRAKATLKELQESTARADQTERPAVEARRQAAVLRQERRGGADGGAGDRRHLDGCDSARRGSSPTRSTSTPTARADGKVDIKAIKEIRPTVGKVVTALTAARKELRGHRRELAPACRCVARSARSSTRSAAPRSAADSANLAAKLLPDDARPEGDPALPADGPEQRRDPLDRRHPGSIAILKAKNGKLSMGFQGSSRTSSSSRSPSCP